MAPVETSANPSAMVPRSCRLPSLMNSFLVRLSSVMVAVLWRGFGSRASIHVALVAAGLRELFQLGATGFVVAAGGFREDTSEHDVNVARHALLVAAHVDVRAVLDPFEQLGAVLPQPLLHVDLFRLIARKGDVDARQRSVCEILLPLQLVEEVVGEVTLSKDQTALAGCAIFHAVFDEGAVGCNSGAGADHN